VPYVITGGSGYLGSRLVDLLSRREDTERIVICDVPAPRENKPKSQFERLGVRDRDGVRAVLDRARPDALVHLAFILTPVHDEAVEHPGELARAGVERVTAQHLLHRDLDAVEQIGLEVAPAAA
jgi:nucleoside-diphosphate-sugar epimerase